MTDLSSLSDSEIVERLPTLVRAERHAMVDVIEHLVEVERRGLYRTSRITSLLGYCMQELGYDEDSALKRHRVAKLALRFPQVLEELRAGTMHLTGLFLLAKHLREDNASTLLAEARGKSRRELEKLIARWFPRSDVPPSLEPVGVTLTTAGPSVAPVSGTCTGAGEPVRGRLEPLSPSRLRVQFTARAELYEKIEKARELLSHALPSGDLGELFERALDALLEQETRKRFGSGKPRRTRPLKPGSRYVPLAIQRSVWERAGSQCTFVDGEGHRCAERRFLTLEHRTPFALGGPPTLENLCLLCSAHNLASARRVFGAAYIEAKIRENTQVTPAVSAEAQPTTKPPLEAAAQVISSLCGLGFGRSEASATVGHALGSEAGLDVEQLLRKCLLLLVPKAG